MNVFELRIAGTESSAKVLKILRGYYPDVPFSDWKQKIEGGEAIFSCDKDSYSGRKQLVRLSRSLQEADIPIEMFEQKEDGIHPLDVELIQALYG